QDLPHKESPFAIGHQPAEGLVAQARLRARVSGDHLLLLLVAEGTGFDEVAHLPPFPSLASRSTSFRNSRASGMSQPRSAGAARIWRAISSACWRSVIGSSPTRVGRR